MVVWTRETPWRQGHLLTVEAINALGLHHPEYPDDSVVIVATHDCDLAQAPIIEPLVELVIGRRIAQFDGNYTHAKTARTLHIAFEDANPLLAEFVIANKCAVSKAVLAGFEPETNSILSPTNRTTFQRWLAARYHRSAFPDEFERRLVRVTKLAERLNRAVKPQGEMITAVVFDVDEGEEMARNGEDDVYILDIILVHTIEPDFEAAQAAANAAKEAIKRDFEKKLFDKQSGKWKYIELRYVDVLSEEAFTYRQFTLMKRWRLDYISLGAESQQPIVPE